MGGTRPRKRGLSCCAACDMTSGPFFFYFCLLPWQAAFDVNEVCKVKNATLLLAAESEYDRSALSLRIQCVGHAYGPIYMSGSSARGSSSQHTLMAPKARAKVLGRRVQARAAFHLLRLGASRATTKDTARKATARGALRRQARAASHLKRRPTPAVAEKSTAFPS